MQKLGERLGQPIVVENRAGANGVIGAAAVAKSPPDGYTLLFSHVGPIAISPAMQNDMPYDSVKDFEPVTQVVSAPLVLVVRPDLPIKTLQGRRRPTRGRTRASSPTGRWARAARHTSPAKC